MKRHFSKNMSFLSLLFERQWPILFLCKKDPRRLTNSLSDLSKSAEEISYG